LRQCMQDGRVSTQYSYTFNLRTGNIEMYRFGEGPQGVDLDLGAELAKGPHYYDIPALAEQVDDGTAHPLLLNMQRMCLYHFAALADQAPGTTARVRQLLVDAAAGRMRRAQYADSLWRALAPIGQEIRAELAALGGIRSATLIDRTAVDG